MDFNPKSYLVENFQMIERAIEHTILHSFFRGKAIILFGPRQSGKSTLIEKLLKGKDFLHISGDDATIRQAYSNTDADAMRLLIGSYKILFIDEAQRIPDVGLTIKLFTDRIKDVQVIATGSSAFELAGQINESLTGRKYEHMLYPLSFGEMVKSAGLMKEKISIPHRMVYGYYPEIVTNAGDEKKLLRTLSNSYLYKDLLTLDQVKKPVLLEKLLQALALQVGNEVSYHELGKLTNSDSKTVEKYIDLLEKAFVVFKIPALNKNVRNEIKKGKKIYFFDCGVRNAIINNFEPVENRTDAGALWENFVIAERMKLLSYQDEAVKLFFWRTTQQQEIDLIEDYGTFYKAFEFKFGTKAGSRLPSTFIEHYAPRETGIITPGNIEQFLIPA